MVGKGLKIPLNAAMLAALVVSCIRHTQLIVRGPAEHCTCAVNTRAYRVAI
jgi:hypothetical protein